MNHLVFKCEQGGDEWHNLRAGCITASKFADARSKVNCLTDQQQKYVDAIFAGKTETQAREAAGYKAAPKAAGIELALEGKPVGEFSSTAKDYAFRLAIERISGEPLDEGFQNWAMRRGNELEPRARMEHEIQAGVFVERTGFVKTADGAFGASADGFIGKEEGSEYKCFLAPEKLREFYIDNSADSIKDQVQGCMWITGRKRWHVGLYCPALEPIGRQLWWDVFERDDEYIAKLEKDLLEFKAIVDAYEAKLRSGGYAITPSIPT